MSQTLYTSNVYKLAKHYSKVNKIIKIIKNVNIKYTKEMENYVCMIVSHIIMITTHMQPPIS